MQEAVGEVFPKAKYPRYIVHFNRNILSATSRSKAKYGQKAESDLCVGKQQGDS